MTTTPETIDDIARRIEVAEALLEECLTLVRNRKAVALQVSE